MTDKKSIKFMGIDLIPVPTHCRDSSLQYAKRAHPYGHVQIRRVPSPRNPQHENVFDLMIDGAIIGRALRPGEAAKRGEKWLMKVFANHLKHQRELKENKDD